MQIRVIGGGGRRRSLVPHMQHPDRSCGGWGRLMPDESSALFKHLMRYWTGTGDRQCPGA